MKEDKRVCNNCEWFEMSPGKCVETCNAERDGLDKNYSEQRMNGNINHCKEKRIIKL